MHWVSQLRKCSERQFTWGECAAGDGELALKIYLKIILKKLTKKNHMCSQSQEDTLPGPFQPVCWLF